MQAFEDQKTQFELNSALGSSARGVRRRGQEYVHSCRSYIAYMNVFPIRITAVKHGYWYKEFHKNFIRFCFVDHCFTITVENTGVLNSFAVDFLDVLGRRISSSSGEERESLFLFQRISITMQCFNAILLHNCFVRDDPDL